MARHRLSQKMNKPIWFFFALQSGNTWNLKSKSQVSSISGLSWQKKKLFVPFLGEFMVSQSAFGFIWPLIAKRNRYLKKEMHFDVWPTCVINYMQGVVHKLRWQDFGFFWPPTPLRWQFLRYERWQKVDIFGPPTYLVLKT